MEVIPSDEYFKHASLALCREESVRGKNVSRETDQEGIIVVQVREGGGGLDISISPQMMMLCSAEARGRSSLLG